MYHIMIYHYYNDVVIPDRLPLSLDQFSKKELPFNQACRYAIAELHYLNECYGNDEKSFSVMIPTEENAPVLVLTNVLEMENGSLDTTLVASYSVSKTASPTESDLVPGYPNLTFYQCE